MKYFWTNSYFKIGLSSFFILFFSIVVHAQLEYIGSSSDESIRSLNVLDNAVYIGLYSGPNNQGAIIYRSDIGNDNFIEMDCSTWRPGVYVYQFIGDNSSTDQGRLIIE